MGTKMNGLKMRHLLAIPLIVLLIISIAARCTELKPAADRLVHVPDLMKAHQDSADKRRGFDAARSKIVVKH